MVYIDYHNYLIKYHSAQKLVDRILDEKEIVFQKTQPKSTLADHERDYDKKINIHSSGRNENANVSEAYVIELEQKKITERLEDAKSIMQDRLVMVRQKEIELRESHNKYDRVYVMRYLDSMNARDIADSLDYSETHVFRMLRTIHHEISNMAENGSK